MLTIPRHTSRSLFFLFCFTLLLTLFLSLPWVNAKETPKPKPQDWQINGIVAALDDGHDQVKKSAFDKLNEYDLQNLKSVVEKPENIADKAFNILKDKSVDSDVRSSAAVALGNLGEAAKPYVKDILDILKDKSVDINVRSSAAEALGNLGEAAKPYVKDILDILKDKSVDSDVRSGAAKALGNLGEAAKPYVKDILDFLKDKSVDSYVRSDAAEALGNLGEAAKPYVKDILDFLKDKSVDKDVRSGAAEALGNLGEAAKPYVKDILDFLKDKSVDKDVRSGAAEALGNLGEAAKPYVKDILDILKDKSVDSYVRSGAAEALGNLGEAAKPYVKDIADILKDKSVDSNVRYGAASALGNLGEAAKPYVKDILDFLKDKSVDSGVRSGAAVALGNLGEAAKPYVKDILDILKDKSVDINVRSSAAEALGNLGEAAKPYVKDIADILKDKSVDSGVRYGAAVALGNLGDAAKPYVKDILDFLKDKSVNSYVPYGAAVALGKIKQLELNEIVVILDSVYYAGQSEFARWRFLTYFLGGGTDEVKTLLTWLGFPKKIPASLPHDQGVKTLNIFAQAWEPSQDFARLREDLAKQIAVVARKVSWQPQDIVILETHYKNLKKAGYSETDSLQAAIVNLKGWQWFFNARITILTHAAFWLLLIFAYPKSPQIQAIFFWNPWVRRILGMGYVGFLLTWVPFFRRKLLEPFKPSLLADAGLDNFHDQSYFPQSQVKVTSGDILPITAALPSIKGQIILEGDSGLGKSMFLRHLLQNQERIVVYLPAQKCDKGVIEAIQEKLHGQAQDAGFLKNLIYSGAIDICIDGLNEVTAETRAKICQFVESYFRGNIIMTTQPLEWTPPSTAKTYYLQPLEQSQIQEFLLSRQQRLPKDAKIQGADYAQACTNYLTEVLKDQQAQEELEAARRILSNPMDLTVVALMLSQGKHPNLFRLQEQQYNLMAAEYLKEWNQEFPLKKFSAAVYEMRLQDKQALPADEFHQVAMSLSDEKYKMVVSRQWQDDKGEAKKEWYFRHDKIMDFFLVQNFLGETDAAEGLLVDRMGDPRFRGVYFLLATLLPLDAAKELREDLIQYAADTKDNTVSNTFVQLLRTR
ncbi:HEAT repeat domain-containing protein [Nostoc punctiforme]|uniref:PBS lyase HEAT domain protein repeat-containing protein n=1 Tax=Nostoc punctiforme (strain ATCC 29133 / PCC 73102) TaxID=63737 RepID=B2J9L8_NOSP7|nr:HEAT repeat domain-containing protein [Nostoc punctiforme]ACC81045.1 PBS lyase HEAT domain protein repeat-containing protein [Nostoc punctiforme PCC 73102]